MDRVMRCGGRTSRAAWFRRPISIRTQCSQTQDQIGHEHGKRCIIPKKLRIIDPHVHYWTPERYPWLIQHRNENGRMASICRSFLPSDYRKEMLPISVEQTIHIQANWPEDDCIGETEWQQSLADSVGNEGHPQGICSYAPLHRPNKLQAVLEKHRQYHNFKGIRFMLDFDDDTGKMSQTDKDYLDDAFFHQGMKILQQNGGLVFELQLCQAQLKKAAQLLVRKYPDVNFILNHAGFPLSGSQKRSEWQDGLKALAENENVFVKISGLGMWEGGWMGAERIAPYVEDIIERFGVERCMFASNLPVDIANGRTSLGIWEDFYTVAHQLMNLDKEDIDALFYHNAALIYTMTCDLPDIRLVPPKKRKQEETRSISFDRFEQS